MFPAWDLKPRTLQRKRLRRFVAVGKWRQIVWSLKKVKFASISILLIEFSQILGYGKMNLLSQPNDIITPERPWKDVLLRMKCDSRFYPSTHEALFSGETQYLNVSLWLRKENRRLQWIKLRVPTRSQPLRVNYMQTEC